MRKLSTGLTAKQAGFTLIELVIVIVIIGILAAVAIPKLTGISDSAQKASNTAVLGALKSAWSGAYATKKSAPTPAEVNLLMADPTCALSGGVFTCGTVGQFTTTYTAALTGTVIDSTAAITCTTVANCN